LYGVFSLAILAVVLTYTWIVAPAAPPSAAGVATAAVVALAFARAITSGEWGLTRAEFVPALKWSAALTAVAALVIYAAGSRLGTWHTPRNPWGTLAVLIPWALGQQFALQIVFLREAQAITSKSGGIWLAALMFAALHLPNPFLTLVTGISAVAWCWIYDRHPNVLPLALSHALLTLAVLSAFDAAITGRLRVGVAYLALARP
jgi:hypothetical protein